MEKKIMTRKVITLCGSTKFKPAYNEWNARLTLEEDAVVMSVSMWGHADKISLTKAQKEQLDSIHKSKIDLSDEIFVLDVGGYIGESTRSEIEYAIKNNKRVRYLSKEYPE